jgi:hypothetical protein
MAGMRIAGDASSGLGRKQKPYGNAAYWHPAPPPSSSKPLLPSPFRTALACTAVLVLVCLAGSVARPAAAAGKPACWQLLLNDWYDGRIDGTYPIHCYQDALKHLPSDVDTYSSARDDIERALQSARLAARRAGAKVGPETLIRPSKPGTKSGVGKNVITIAAGGRKPPTGPIQNVADSSNASSLPLPLLILGGLALLLVAAGAGGLGWRHYQGRKPRS